MLKSKYCPPDNIPSKLKRIPFNGFNNIKVSLNFLGKSPVTTCSEWSFSALRRLKTYARSIMVSERLNAIAVMLVHQETVPEIEKVIDLFSTKNRTLTFTSNTVNKNLNIMWTITFFLILFRMVFLGCSQMGGQNAPSLKSVTHILQWWNLAQLYLI